MRIAGGEAPNSESGSTTLETRPPAGPLGRVTGLPLVLGALLDGALLLVWPAGLLEVVGLGVLVTTTSGTVTIGAVGTTLLEGADARLLPTAFTAAMVKV